MNKNEIKNIVYKCLYDQYFDEDVIIKLQSKHDDGLDELIYKELNFDSLDMIEFILNIEINIGNDFHFDDDFVDKEITLRKIIDYIYNKINRNN